MKKIKPVLLAMAVALVFTGCTNIATPEELIEPPELNLEKQSMKEALEKFLPEDSTITALPNLDGVDKEMAFSPIDLNDDGKLEMIAFYKDKNTKLMGMLILSNKRDKWEKISDIKLNSFDILQFKVLDLDNDKNKEIVLGTYSDESISYGKKLTILSIKDNKVTSILEMPYAGMALGDLDKDDSYEIAILYQNEEMIENRLRMMRVAGNKVSKIDEKIFPQGVDPYSIAIGNIYDDEEVIFVDSFSGIYEGRTDIFFFKDKKIKDIEDYKGFKLSDKSFPVQTKDVDSDGIMEVGIPFSPPDNDQLYDPLKPWVKSYYKINKDSTMSLVKQIYEDYKMSFLFEIPDSFGNNYSITGNETSDKIEINFIASDKKAYKLAEIKMINKTKWQETDEVLQIISETNDDITGGKIEDLSNQLTGKDKEQYIKMRSDILNLSNVTKPSGI
ncbi:hypothetical protein [Acetoanaerobium noterae]|uniref:hypothetical protein n=1 Tax=Acetoanaerobium noterae TaxID=745369 RepID=UPI0028AB28A4|nr:hypothetical protein [Acetoanaerobium noterae]